MPINDTLTVDQIFHQLQMSNPPLIPMDVSHADVDNSALGNRHSPQRSTSGAPVREWVRGEGNE